MNRVRIFLAAIALAILAACATSPTPVQRGEMVYQGTYNSNYGNYSNEGPRTTPCQPFNADLLMNWAGGLEGNKQRSRSASANVENGNVRCSQNESASSSQTSPTNK